MKTNNLIAVLFFALASVGFAQGSSPEARRSNTQIIDFILDFQEKRLVDIAEAMPAEKYGFAPSAGEFTGVRTFAEQLTHIAADNFLLGAGIVGEKPPRDVGVDERGAGSVQTKDQIIAYLRDSFVYMHRAAATIDDAKRSIPTPGISPWPNGTATRLGVAIEDCVHSWDHYGQLVEYLRMNGIIPPGSRSDGNKLVAGQTAPTISQAIDFWITNTENEVVSAAAAMPEEKYSFAPTAGAFAGVRTFGEQVKHLAANNYRMAAHVLGQDARPDQEAETGPEDVRSKAQIMDYVRGSFLALHQSVATITIENEVSPALRTRLGTPRQNTRVQFAIDAVAHSYDHYGQLVEYLRMNGIIPPASRR
ncbi:MAG TPA: DinB family protein [Candidatus Sulfotelmatobacter sp.]|nr:DinB family protein [Candidatus Sulfotelmatobacter sp.]